LRKTVRKTAVEWATHHWSPLIGCSTGCVYCFARAYGRRFGASQGCQQCADFVPHLHENEFPATWPTNPSVVFVVPRGDLWSAGVPQEWRDRVFVQLRKAFREDRPLDFVILTKRPQEITAKDRRWFVDCWSLWVGVSVTGPEDAWRYRALCEAVPAGRRLLSMEPLLERTHGICEGEYPAWAIIGPQTPVMHTDHEMSAIVRYTVELWGGPGGIPVFVKPAAQKAWPGVPLVQEWPDSMYYKPAASGQAGD